MIVGLTGFHGAEGQPGFIGRWLTATLEGAGHEVVPLYGDVRQRWTFTKRTRSGEPVGRVAPSMLDGVDVVVHLAARVGRLLCDEAPQDVVDTNAFGTWNVAEAARAAGARMLYVSSSEAVYAGNLYGLTKRWGEEAARLVFADQPARFAVARLFMPYGPGHPPGHGRAALTNWIWEAMTRQPLTVHKGTSRSWCWVGDTAAALRLLIEQWPAPARSQSAEAWNVGRVDNVMSSLATAQLVVRRFAEGDYSLIRQVEKPAGIADHKLPDVRPLYALGWRPTIDLAEGVGYVADWLRTWDEVRS